MAGNAFPKRVTLDDAATRTITKLYQETQAAIVRDIVHGVSDDYNVRRQLQLIDRIDAILNQLGAKTRDWLDQEVPKHYMYGTNDALKQMSRLKLPVKYDEAFGVIDREAVNALISDASLSFGNSLTTAKRSTQKVLTDASRREIRMRLAEGRIAGEAKNTIVDSIKSHFLEKGIIGLTDKAGRDWGIDRYANMLVQTKLTEARNTGMANKMAANGYDLVIISDHGASDSCADYEGEVLSLTGATPGYKTIDEAQADSHLFGPNCRHAMNAVVQDIEGTVSWDSASRSYT